MTSTLLTAALADDRLGTATLLLGVALALLVAGLVLLRRR
ncbi:hypothetical protein I601_1244 [Nocardioides dokdonensis FR1436]|uniref:Uncharacterized protein n=1 Tax=Nocardioides dokdonensis FR1436 TaxID=1300347 RepID=A0A1A9GHX9_9ACTN|nr:hypothetical protein I601_1244 [Nocardioides dokdonensis FR1436]